MSTGIKEGFAAITSGIVLGAKMRRVFDEARDILRALESGQVKGPGWAGRLAGLARALNVLDGWPSVEYREKYMPRIKIQVRLGCEGMEEEFKAWKRSQG